MQLRLDQLDTETVIIGLRSQLMFSTVMLHQVIHGDGTGAAGVRLGPVYVAVSSLIKVYEGSKTTLLAKPQALLLDDEL